MPRIRTIKPEFFTSPGTAAVDFPVRIFYEALWCAADDFGVGETNFNSLLGLAFPDSDGFSAQDVRRFCADCAQHYGTIFYAVRGRHFYYIPTWDKHQKTERRETRRRFPTPDDPDATPDQRIYGGADFAPDSPRKSGADSRENVAGTGEQGNRGTGEEQTCATKLRDSTPRRFEEFWTAYPRRRDRRKAEKAFTAALKRADADTIIAGAYRYATDPNRQDQYTKYAEGWLNGDCWLDEPLPARVTALPARSTTDAKGIGWLQFGQERDARAANQTPAIAALEAQ